jgi:hypothetical protein
MKTYQHTQPARTIVISLTTTGLVFAVGSIFCHPLISGALVAFIVAYFFRSMTIEISDAELIWYFGSGFPRKRLPLGDVVSAEAVRMPFWNGWGIHYTPQGWLYNVSGYGAVCVTLRNGKRLCLGSDEPEVLAGRLAKTPEG